MSKKKLKIEEGIANCESFKIPFFKYKVYIPNCEEGFSQIAQAIASCAYEPYNIKSWAVIVLDPSTRKPIWFWWMPISVDWISSFLADTTAEQPPFEQLATYLFDLSIDALSETDFTSVTKIEIDQVGRLSFAYLPIVLEERLEYLILEDVQEDN